MFREMGFDEVAKDLERLGNVDRYAPELLKAAAPVLKNELKGQVRKNAAKYATGALAESIEANEPSKNKYGHYVSVTAKGKDKKGVRNNEKLAYLEYGTSRQAQKPMIAPAIKSSEKKCLEAMQKKFDEVAK